jgi:hypothetical protein
MSSYQTISSIADLRTWVDSHTPGDVSEADVNAITRAISSMNHPTWGADWADWLAELPEYLIDLMEEADIA